MVGPKAMSLVVLRGPDFGMAFPVPVGETIVGRHPDCDVVIPDGTVSRRHARIDRDDDGRMTLVDLGSAGGQFVNGTRTTKPCEIRPGDTLAFGPNFVVCVVAGDPGLETPVSVQPPPTDAVTRVASRSAFVAILRAACEEAAVGGEALSVVALDIDRLAQFNARHGHLAGDQMLRRVCARLEEVLPHADALARWSAREFVALLRRTDLQHALRLAERLLEAVATERVSACAGVSTLAPEHERPADLVEEAIVALREHAKPWGPGTARAPFGRDLSD